MSNLIKLSAASTGDLWEIEVVHEDEHLFALNKPPGLLTSPDRYDPTRPNLMKLLHGGIAARKSWAKERGLTYAANVHRLDFETSGVLLIAKSKSVLTRLADLFGTEQLAKTYAALVRGTPHEDTWEIDAPLGPHPAWPGRMRVDRREGKRSRTSFAVRERFQGYTLVECHPHTGRTHQIRVHLQHVGLPILADRLYGGKPLYLSQLKTNYQLKPGRTERALIGSLALHAERLALMHPVTGSELVMTAPWPKDLLVAVRYLQRYAR